jgi:hypothetical protein
MHESSPLEAFAFILWTFFRSVVPLATDQEYLRRCGRVLDRSEAITRCLVCRLRLTSGHGRGNESINGLLFSYD